ncbi:DUF192 domain-containing protein [Paracoccus xiamenensis]|uniref:DUF192 domain-containing protein n=1 Tax=Paracoccus xiamenensis TaxID=2714901 RepID=UPI00140D0C8E|nr:DUF192 domain-containing protein [Paracoccus xiamenensis]NHF72259.1 DUF192 domain-containing protein [Paracoccus xiamenensis]
MIRNSVRLLPAIAVALAGASASFATSPAPPSCQEDIALFPTAERAIRVEIADDPAERAQGLMNRSSLAENSGMLFIFEEPREAAFWMKNTLIPLDMIFMDAKGVIRHIHPSAVPHDLTPVPGAAPGDPAPERLMVLEVAGGEAARLGLTVGMAMSHPRLDQKQAAAPCR